MKINLKTLKEGITEYWEECDTKTLSLPEGEFSLVGNLKAHYRLRKSGKTLEFKIETTYTLELTCSRCLEKFKKEFRENAIYTVQVGTEKFEEEKELTTDEILMLFIPTEELDTVPILREIVLLSIPMKPLCRPDCKGLCPVCGANLNYTTCEHVKTKEKKIDPRWQKLLELKTRMQ